MDYFRDNIDAMSAYVPGEQPRTDAKIIKLNTNENPYPPSEKAMKVLRELDGDLLRRYPHPMGEKFRRSAAEVIDFPVDWILAGNGSDDLITMIARACTSPDRPVVYPVPTFEWYQTQAEIQGSEPAEVAYDEDYNLPVDELVEADGAVTLVACPNSPSGTGVEIEDLDRLGSAMSGLLVIDEAYVDFADQDALELVRKYENVIVLRTLSKGYSLAGLRLGYAVARPEVLAGLMKVKDIYNVSAVGCEVGAAAMEDQDHKAANVAKIKSSRAKLTAELERLGFRVWKSQANFLLVRPPDGEAESIYLQLKDQGIFVRYFNTPRLSDKLRITVGREIENIRLIQGIVRSS